MIRGLRHILAAGLVAMGSLSAVAIAPVDGVATVQAAVTVSQGSPVMTPVGACSLAVLNSRTAYTSAHCGNHQWEVDSPVTNKRGARIGMLAAIDYEADVAKIRLDEGIVVAGGDLTPRDTDTLREGEDIHFYGKGAHVGPVHVSSTKGSVWIDGKGAVLLAQPHLTFHGMSGGTTTDGEGRFVGILAGRVNDNDGTGDHTGFVPWNIIKESVGE